MVHTIKHGSRGCSGGFTLIELMVVLLLVALLASFVMPTVVNSIERAKESALKENLKVIRDAIDDYYTDTGQYPESLELLVEERYIRRLPVDPVLDDSKEWELKYYSGAEGTAIMDLHSRSQDISSEGTPYNSW